MTHTQDFIELAARKRERLTKFSQQAYADWRYYETIKSAEAPAAYDTYIELRAAAKAAFEDYWLLML